MAHDFKVLDSQLLVEAPIIALRRDEVVMPGGVSASREVVEHLGAVAVVAVDSDERIAMVYQYRHSVGKRLWELPAGLLDVRGEDELTGAQRELQEEAGLSAQTWSVLTDLVTSPGFCEEAVRVSWPRSFPTSPGWRLPVTKKPIWKSPGWDSMRQLTRYCAVTSSIPSPVAASWRPTRCCAAAREPAVWRSRSTFDRPQ